MHQLRRVFLPVMLRTVLRRRRRMRWKDGQPPRRYNADSVVAAIMGSKSRLADFPQRLLENLADGATFRFLAPRETIVYANESHVSCGIVVLLHGQLEERRPEPGGGGGGAGAGSSGTSSSGKAKRGGTGASRPIHTQLHRLHKAMDVLCLMPVLCEDRATSFFTTREREEADVAIIPSRWFWEVAYSMTQASLPAADVIGRTLREVVLPHRSDILMTDYFPTSAVLLRSWMWPMLTASDRVKLCRSMEVRVLSVGDVLFDEGDYCPYLYVVRRGCLTAIVKGEALAVLDAGTAVGEESILFHDRRNCSVVAATVCELYALHMRHLLHRFVKYPECGHRVVTAAMERQRRWMEEGRTRDIFGLVSILSGVPCLVHTTDAMREEMAQCAAVLTLPQGHTLAVANTPCSFFCVVGRGTVALTSVVRGATELTSLSSPSAAGRTGDAPPGRRRASSAKAIPAPPAPETRREVRSAGDFFGELCLRPHLWPYDVVCDSTVSVWQFDRAAVLRILEKNRADAQAIDVCRQGISLYRAQRGEASIVDGFDVPATPTASTTGRRSSAGSQRSRAPSTDVAAAAPPTPGRSGSASNRSGGRPSVSIGGGGGAEAVVEALTPRGGVDWTPEQWTTYAITRLQDGVRAEEEQDAAATATAAAPAPTRDLRDVDKEVEKAMKEKVLQLVAVQPETGPSPADCDISGDPGELQSIIVEQLFLIVTERQPRFLRQVNDSNVRLITEEDDIAAVGELNDSLDDMTVIDAMQISGAPVAVTELAQLEDLRSPPLEDDLLLSPGATPSSTLRRLADSTDIGALRLVNDALVAEANSGTQTGWPVPTPSVGRTRRSTSVGAIAEASGVFGTSLNPRMSLGRSHFVRPSSGVPPSPRSGGRDDVISPATSSMARPSSSSEPRVIPSVRARPTSVDFNQFNNKLSLDRSTSVLDRYVKIEDQNYFDNYVKVLPLQQDEMWAPDEANADNEMSAGSMVLLLLHVVKCDHLSAEVMQRCARPIVKVMLGQRVLVRTSVMDNCTAPRWPIERSSFISFVRRGTDIVFCVCDADDESRVVYQTSLPTGSIHENGGVGQSSLSLTEVAETGSPVSRALEAEVEEEADGGKSRRGAKKPRLTTTMLAVTATRYKALRQYLETREEKLFVDAPAADGSEGTALFLQVMAVDGLKHRIDATVTVSLYNGGTSRTLLETERVTPKTRSPAWGGAKSFVKVCGEGGVLTFDLHHKGSVISSTEATVDELIFGGVGLRRLPLLQAQTGNLVMGHLVVGVLGAIVRDAVESRNRDWVTHLAVEELALARDGFFINPDPFVVLRDGTGVVRLRTPLACCAFQASWSMAEASCLLQCPRLSGSTVSYQLEVCDSDEQEVIGRATIVLSDRGLGPEHRHEVPLDPPGRGVVRLRSLCLPVLELPAGDAAATPSPSVAAGGGSKLAALPPRPVRSQLLAAEPSPLLLLLHVCGCTDLPGGASVELQTDAIGTFAINTQQFLRTSLQEATTAPRWPFSKASVLLRVPPLEESGSGDDGVSAEEAERLERERRRRGGQECLFAVYDGVVDDVSHIGHVAVPLSQLLSSGMHSYPLFPRRKGGAKAAAPAAAAVTQVSVSAAARERAAAAERTTGQVQVFTMFGLLDQQVRQAAVPADDTLLLSIPNLDRGGGGGGAARPSGTAVSAQLPYYNPESADGAAASAAARGSSSTLATTVVLSVSNICHVLPSATEKSVHVVVRHGTTVLLSAERQMGASSHAEWGPADASAAVSCGALPPDAVVTVELAAMGVVFGRDEEEDGVAPASAGGEVVSPKNGDAVRHTATKGGASTAAVAKMSLGHGELAASALAGVAAGEVQVVTVLLTGGERASTTADSDGRPPKVAPSTRGTGGARETRPSVSFCVFGRRV
ncbi:cAMP binding protein [Novymonas esmeraldas]|uniref:cAMP binding protein n=1 Tax=Novymonas esmeraldas TaxID=1808958 RepID=A0AAW0F566_9TRYP